MDQRLARIIRPPWLAPFVVAAFFSLQHCTLPLVLDAKFVSFRAVMYLPFALLLGAVAYWRRSLLPWVLVLNGALDALPVFTLLTGGWQGR